MHIDGKTYKREFTKELEIIFDLWTNKAIRLNLI
jgi:hypothetical protein